MSFKIFWKNLMGGATHPPPPPPPRLVLLRVKLSLQRDCLSLQYNSLYRLSSIQISHFVTKEADILEKKTTEIADIYITMVCKLTMRAWHCNRNCTTQTSVDMTIISSVKFIQRLKQSKHEWLPYNELLKLVVCESLNMK